MRKQMFNDFPLTVRPTI